MVLAQAASGQSNAPIESDTERAMYSVGRPGSLPMRLAYYQRRKMFAAFLAATRPTEVDTVLDIGATSDRSYDHSNYLEAWYPHKSHVTAAGIDEGARFLEALYPGLTFTLADGRDLPFADRAFDFVHSSAVLEHVGNRIQQAQFLRECWRVARKGIFITTPNRWFPVEFHTVLPLAHWLPPSVFRRLLAGIGKEFFAREENLNLMSGRSLSAAAKAAGIPNHRVSGCQLAGWTTNLLLIALKA
jgi:hypothetical protein